MANHPPADQAHPGAGRWRRMPEHSRHSRSQRSDPRNQPATLRSLCQRTRAMSSTSTTPTQATHSVRRLSVPRGSSRLTTNGRPVTASPARSRPGQIDQDRYTSGTSISSRIVGVRDRPHPRSTGLDWHPPATGAGTANPAARFSFGAPDRDPSPDGSCETPRIGRGP